MKFSALLHAKWKPGPEPTEIVGRWAEDESTYTMDVPEQLRDLLVELQNHLADRYAQLRLFTRKVNEAVQFWEELGGFAPEDDTKSL